MMARRHPRFDTRPSSSTIDPRLVMTAPKPKLKRLISEPEDASSTSSESTDEHHRPITTHIRRNLFSPKPLLSSRDQENVVPMNEVQVTYMSHGSLMKSSASSPVSKKKAGLSTPMKTPKRSSNAECGLTSEINRELFDNRRPSGFNTPSKGNTNRKVMETPSDKNKHILPRVPQTDSKLLITKTSSSSSVDDFQGLTCNIIKEGEEKAGSSYAFGTPIRKGRKKNPSLTFSALSSKKKLKKALTPPREHLGSHMKERLKAGSTAGCQGLNMGTSFPGVEDFRITSTELEPSEFQVELPSKKEMTVHGKICSMIDEYTTLHRNFNFAILAGVSRNTLENEYKRSTSEKPMIAGSAHRDVVAKILDCCDDLVVEGFFREYGEDPQKQNGKDRMEACIFSSEKLRQLIVCYRGSTANQAKPLRSNMFGKEASSLLHEEQPVRVHSTFRDAYFSTTMEETVFALLENLATRKPFFDVVMTGHSFGAAMATIGAMRYAVNQPMIRVSCHVFGAPRIGGEEWRQMAHSVPNLKIFRAENGSDPFIMLPSGSEWLHVGHAISFGESTESGVEFSSRKFDRDRIASTTMFRVPKVNLPVNSLLQSNHGKHSNGIKHYVEKLSSSGDKWFFEFSGLKGKGVNGTDNETRTIA